MDSNRSILPPEPHYLSGYAGFVPGIKFHCGESYGKLTNTLFMNPSIKRSKKSVLVELGQVHTGWLSKKDEQDLRNRCLNTKECKYTKDLPTGYGGYVPHKKYSGGHKFSVDAAIGICKFTERKNRCLCPECKPLNVEENGSDLSKTNENKTYTRPSKEVPGGSQKFKELYSYKNPMHPITPYFMEVENPQKYFKLGYTGHVPTLAFNIGTSHHAATNEALKLFTSRYEKEKADAKLPVIINFSKPRLTMESRRIPYESGIIKNYAGHIPGSIFNVGKTFNEGSKSTRMVLGLNK